VSKNLHVAIISARRPSAVKSMSDLGWSGTWYVAEGDEEAYKQAGATSVVVAGGLISARNKALDEAFSQGKPCLQLSDDCTRLCVLGKEGKEQETTSDEIVKQMLAHLSMTNKLVGIAPVANAFYCSHNVKRCHFILGDLFIASPSSIRFDSSLRLKEDYDYTCQHIFKFGEVARLDWIIAGFKHRSNEGGAVSYRTAELEQQAIAVLKKKWGDWIKPNPRRPNEILLKIPRAFHKK